MFVIRPEQLAALEDAADRAFAEEVLNDLRARHPGRIEHVSPDELRAAIRDAIASGRAHGLTSRNDLRTFAVLRVLVGRDFDHHPLVARFLDDPELPAEVRMRTLLRDMTEEEWTVVARSVAP